MRQITMKIFGIGDRGNSMIWHMLQQPLQGVEYIAVNTNQHSLKQFSVKQKLLLEQNPIKEYGTEAATELGKRAARSCKEEIIARMKGADMVLLCGGLGSDMGSGALPVFAQLAKQMHTLTIAFVTLPFPFEEEKRMCIAKSALEDIYTNADTCITLSNQYILQQLNNTEIKSACSMADRMIQQGIQALYELITIPVYINVDYADIRTTMAEQKHGFIGVGYGRGAYKGEQAVAQALSACLLEHDIAGLHHAIVHICGNSALTLDEVQQIINRIHDEAGEALDIIFGMAFNENLQDELIVTVLAAGG